MQHFLNLHLAFFIFISTGLLFVLAGIFMVQRPPKKINNLIGYRTKRSMKDQNSWDFAQKFSGKWMIYSGAVLCFLSIPFLFVQTTGNTNLLALIPVVIVAFVAVIKTESALKKLNH